MARVTVEDCLVEVGDRFSLVHLAAQRVKVLKKGVNPKVHCNNREIVTALREIAAAKIPFQKATLPIHEASEEEESNPELIEEVENG